MWWSSVASASTFTPPVATAIAGQWDKIYAFLLWGSLLSFILLIGGMIVFVFKYKRKSENDKTAYITHDHTLEFLWSFIPFCIFMFTFAWGWIVYHKMRTVPENALEVNVVAKKWDWRFMYRNGKEVTSGLGADGKPQAATMVVPVNRPVKLIMASEKINPKGDVRDANGDGKPDAWGLPTDQAVLHSLFIPAFRIKQDVVPGRYTYEWFQAEKLGEYWIFCTEYCGTGHSNMLAKVKVVTNDEFDKWLAEEAGAAGSLADQGRALYGAKACVGCHSIDGSRLVGPSFKGLWGRTEETSGGTIKADENYIKESILNPSAKIVNGYQPAMPAYVGQLTDDEINALIEFIKTLK